MAGYRALRYLHDHDPETLRGLSDETLSGWVPAVRASSVGARAVRKSRGKRFWHSLRSGARRLWRSVRKPR